MRLALVAGAFLALGCSRRSDTGAAPVGGGAFAPDDRSRARPPLGPLPPPRLAPARSAVLPNGVRVIVAPTRDEVRVSLLALRGGTAEEGSLPGIADATSALFGGRFHAGLATAPVPRPLSGLNSNRVVSGRVAWTYKDVPPEALGDALWGFAWALRHFTPTADDLVAYRDRKADDLGLAPDTEVARMEQTLLRETARDGAGVPATAAQVRALTLPDVTSWFRARYVPRATALLVEGPVSFDEVMAYAERLFGTWEGPPPSPDAPSSFRLLDRPPRVTVLPARGRPRTTVTAVLTLPMRDAGEHAAAVVFSTLYCGEGLGRVWDVLRGERGDTYAASSGFSFDGAMARLTCAAEVEPGRVADALATMRDVAATMAARGVAPAELERARRFILANRDACFEAGEAAALELIAAARMGEAPERELPGWIAALGAIDSGAVNRYLARDLRVDRMHAVVWGDTPALPQDALGAGGTVLTLAPPAAQ